MHTLRGGTVANQDVAPQQEYDKLSVRDRSVLRRVAEGYDRVEIARMLQITPRTVDMCRTRIGHKLGLAHQTDFLRLALRLGLVGKASQGTTRGGWRS